MMNEKDYFKKYPDLEGAIYKLKKEMGDFLKKLIHEREEAQDALRWFAEEGESDYFNRVKEKLSISEDAHWKDKDEVQIKKQKLDALIDLVSFKQKMGYFYAQAIIERLEKDDHFRTNVQDLLNSKEKPTGDEEWRWNIHQTIADVFEEDLHEHLWKLKRITEIKENYVFDINIKADF